MSGQARVLVVTGSHLCHNPRAHKEAAALSAAGFDVEVLGAWTETSLADQDRAMLRTSQFRYTPVVDLTRGDFSAVRSRHCARLRRGLSVRAHRLFRIESRWQLGNVYPALRRAVSRTAADLAIAHSETALAAVSDFRRRGQQSGVDMEDWFSEDLLPAARRNRPLRMLHQLESDLLVHGGFSSCPSGVMSQALAEAYGCRLPTVIYNAGAWAERDALDGLRKDRRDDTCPSIHWFSQTIGAGRGLEDLFAALPHLSYPAQLHLRGKPMANFAGWLAERVPEGWRDRVTVHGLVPHNELLSRIAEHDIGFAGEMKYCPSRDLTVTNKILQYMLAGVAGVASDTAGQREVAEKAPGAVLIYPSGDPVGLAASLNALLGSRERLRQAKDAALAAAKEHFCWERQAGKLVNAVAAALQQSAPATAKPSTGAISQPVRTRY
jgi:glycosyltransferase involved in cell wall biosynthesis